MTTGGFDPNQYPQGNQPPPGNFPPPPQFNDAGGYKADGQLPGGAQAGGVWWRLGARVIDGIIVGIVAFLLSWVISGDLNNFLFTGLFSGILTFAYFVAMEVTQGRTVGKMALGLRVTAPGGGNPTPKESAIRNAYTLLSIIPILGSLLTLIAEIVIGVTINNSPTKQGKHDEIAGGTQVLKV